jgi:hypothetical protein
VVDYSRLNLDSKEIEEDESSSSGIITKPVPNPSPNFESTVLEQTPGTVYQPIANPLSTEIQRPINSNWSSPEVSPVVNPTPSTKPTPVQGNLLEKSRPTKIAEPKKMALSLGERIRTYNRSKIYLDLKDDALKKNDVAIIVPMWYFGDLYDVLEGSPQAKQAVDAACLKRNLTFAFWSLSLVGLMMISETPSFGSLLFFGGGITGASTLTSASKSARHSLYLYNDDLKKDLEIQEIMQGTQ